MNKNMVFFFSFFGDVEYYNVRWNIYYFRED